VPHPRESRLHEERELSLAVPLGVDAVFVEPVDIEIVLLSGSDTAFLIGEFYIPLLAVKRDLNITRVSLKLLMKEFSDHPVGAEPVLHVDEVAFNLVRSGRDEAHGAPPSSPSTGRRASQVGQK